MFEIRVHGSGGQGAVVASIVLASAFFKEGKFVQAFPICPGSKGAREAAKGIFLCSGTVPHPKEADLKGIEEKITKN